MKNSQYIILPFDSKDQLDRTVSKLKTKNIKIFDIVSTHNSGNYTKQNQFGRIVLIEMIFATLFVIGSIYYLNSSYYPMNTGGISEFNIIPLIPIVFETMILFVVIIVFLVFLYYAKLPSKRENIIIENLNKIKFQIIIDKKHFGDIENILDHD